MLRRMVGLVVLALLVAAGLESPWARARAERDVAAAERAAPPEEPPRGIEAWGVGALLAAMTMAVAALSLQLPGRRHRMWRRGRPVQVRRAPLRRRC